MPVVLLVALPGGAQRLQEPRAVTAPAARLQMLPVLLLLSVDALRRGAEHVLRHCPEARHRRIASIPACGG